MCLPMVPNVGLVLPFRKYKNKCSLPFIWQLFNYLKITIISPSNPVFSKDFVSTTLLGDVAKPHHFPSIPIKVMTWDSVQNQLLTSAQIHCVIFWQFHQLLILKIKKTISSSVQLSSVTQSCPTLCDPMNCSTPGLPGHHQLPEFTNSSPLSQWCHPAISSSVVPFSSCP